MSETATITVDRMLTTAEVARLYSVHQKTVNKWAREKSDKIPKPVYPWGPREPRWFESSIVAHQERIRHECYTP